MRRFKRRFRWYFDTHHRQIPEIHFNKLKSMATLGCYPIELSSLAQKLTVRAILKCNYCTVRQDKCTHRCGTVIELSSTRWSHLLDDIRSGVRPIQDFGSMPHFF